MSAFLRRMRGELRHVQTTIQPVCTESDIWRILFDDARLYSQVCNEAMTLQSEDITLVAGLRWFDEASLFNLASAEAYGECVAVLTIGAAITPQIVAVLETMPIARPG